MPSLCWCWQWIPGLHAATHQASPCSQVTLNVLFPVPVCMFQMETIFGFVCCQGASDRAGNLGLGGQHCLRLRMHFYSEALTPRVFTHRPTSRHAASPSNTCKEKWLQHLRVAVSELPTVEWRFLSGRVGKTFLYSTRLRTWVQDSNSALVYVLAEDGSSGGRAD